MKQENKQLLLKDLCARLPYGVRGKVKADTVVPHKYDIDGFPLETTFDVDVEDAQYCMRTLSLTFDTTNYQYDPTTRELKFTDSLVFVENK